MFESRHRLFMTQKVDYSSFFKSFIKENPPILTQIGNIDPVCPYCDHPLAKMPSRKVKCPSCKNPIHVIVRPIDEKTVLIKDIQVRTVLVQRGIKAGYYLDRIKRIIKTLNNCPCGKWEMLMLPDEQKDPSHMCFVDKIIIMGSEEEGSALRLLCDPYCTCEPLPKIDIPKGNWHD